MSERFVHAEGVRLRAIDEGTGPALLALHGFTGDASTMAEVVHGLTRRARCVRLEFVGHGGSEIPDSIEHYTMGACVRQVLAAVNALELDRPNVVGYSMGGRAALCAASDPASRFRSLTLIGASAGLEDAAARAQRVEADERLADRIEAEGIEAFVEAWMALPLFASQKRLGDAKLERAREQRLGNSVRGLAQSLRGMGAGAQPPLHDRLGSIRIPVLLVAGEEDQKFRDIAQDLESRLPNARCAVIPNAGHAVHLEAPEAFRRVLVEFLNEMESERESESQSERERGAAGATRGEGA